MADKESRQLPTPTIGAVHELNVSIDLMRKGWHVFRALSPACPADLVAYKAPHLLKIQVTKARRKNRKIQYDPHKGEPFDILALSFLSGKIIYIPELPIEEVREPYWPKKTAGAHLYQLYCEYVPPDFSEYDD